MTRYHGTLGNYLGQRKAQKCGYFTPADIQKYLLDISSGLSFLHNHGIMHRGTQLFATQLPFVSAAD